MYNFISTLACIIFTNNLYINCYSVNALCDNYFMCIIHFLYEFLILYIKAKNMTIELSFLIKLRCLLRNKYIMCINIVQFSHIKCVVCLLLLIIDMLKKSSPSRIVNTTSVIQSIGKIDFENLNSEKYHSFPKSYFNSKLAIVLFTKELCERLKGTGNCN